ncbi:MAG: DUF4407 domain-containing protein [Bacteroidota bacterium]
MNKIKSFFWYCSGADIKLLNKCATDSSKYVGIGATVFFTGLFAALAAGYALYTVFDNPFVATITGVLWGLMIFNLDRYIVSSMRKRGNRWSEFAMAIPRLLLAVLISIVIAKPLELRIFEKEVNAELQVMQQEEKSRLENEVSGRYGAIKSELVGEIKLLKDELNSLATKRDELYEIARMEADGTGGTMKRNAGPIYQIKKADADKVQLELDELTEKNGSLIQNRYEQLSRLDSTRKAELAAIKQVQLGGIASRVEALDRLTTSSDAIGMASLFIILLFIAIETAPIFVKLISTKGPYDYVLETAEHKFETDAINDKAYIHDQLKKRSEKLAPREKEFVSDALDIRLN